MNGRVINSQNAWRVTVITPAAPLEDRPLVLGPPVSCPITMGDLAAFPAAIASGTVNCTGFWAQYSVQSSLGTFLSAPFDEAPGSTANIGRSRYRWVAAGSLSATDPLYDPSIFSADANSGDGAVRLCLDNSGTPGCPVRHPIAQCTLPGSSFPPADTASFGGVFVDSRNDMDEDGVPDNCDNCPSIPNHRQRNCNRETEMLTSQQIRGDACDPNPCASVVSIGNRGTLSGAIQPICTNPSDPHYSPSLGVTTRNVVSVLTNGVREASAAIDLNRQIAIRRCPCVDLNGNQVPVGTCLLPLSGICRHNGQRGTLGHAEGWQMADTLETEAGTPVSGCTFAEEFPGMPAFSHHLRCLPSPQSYSPEVNIAPASLAQARNGFEASDNLLTLSWAWHEELEREFPMLGTGDTSGALIPRHFDFAALGSNLDINLWTRASSSELFDATTRLQDHYVGTHYTTVGTTLTTVPAPAFQFETSMTAMNSCGDSVLFEPLYIPWWQWPRGDFMPLSATTSWARNSATRNIAVLAVPKGASGNYSQLTGDIGALPGGIAALAVGIFEPAAGRWAGVGPSYGSVPPLAGTSFAAGTASDRTPVVYAYGAVTAETTGLYAGRLHSNGGSTRTDWSVQSLSTGTDQEPIIISHAPSAATITAPTPRTDVALASSPDGRDLYLFGGRAAGGGQLLSDLWSYNVDAQEWRTIALPSGVAGAASARIVVDEDLIVIYGGVNQNGLTTSALIIVEPIGGVAWTFDAAIAARADAAVAIHDNELWVYGGLSAGESSDTGNFGGASPSNELVRISLTTGDVVSSLHLPVASGRGAAISFDLAGLAYVTPGTVSGDGYSGSVVRIDGSHVYEVALVGGSTTAPTCGGLSASDYGMPCQSDDSWEAMPGVKVCGISSLQCSGSSGRASASRWNLEAVSAYAVAAPLIAVARGPEVDLFTIGGSTTPSASVTLNAPVRAITMTRSMILAATADSIISIEITLEGGLRIVDQEGTCGESTSIALDGSNVLVDTSVGLEFYGLVGTSLSEGPLAMLRGSAANGSPEHSLESVSPGTLPRRACRGMRASLCRSLAGACSAHHSLEVDSNGIAWVTRDSTVYAIDPTMPRESILDSRNFGAMPLSIRSLNSRLAIIGSQDGRPLRALLELRTVPGEARTHDRDGDSRRNDEHDRNDQHRTVRQIVTAGEHSLGGWVTNHTSTAGEWLVHLNGTHLEAAHVGGN